MPPEDGTREDYIVAQGLIPAPHSKDRAATGQDHKTRHSEEEHRRAKVRDVSTGPLEDDPTCPRWLVLAKLQEAQRGRCEEHGRGQNQQPLTDSKNWQSEGFRRLHKRILQVLYKTKYSQCQCLINAVIVDVESAQKHLSGNPT